METIGKEIKKYNVLNKFGRKGKVIIDIKEKQPRIFKKTPLKRSRKPIRKKSSKMALIAKIEDLIRKELKEERGEVCELCRKETCRPVGLFHILSKGTYPRIRLSKANLLLVGWMPCHYIFHNNPYKAIKIIKRIKELRGKDFEEKLKILDKTMPKLTMHRLNEIYFGYKQSNKAEKEI